jgi:hypothetical protein
MEKGLQLTYRGNECKISTPDNIVHTIRTKCDGTYWLSLTITASSHLASLTSTKPSDHTWHQRMAHAPPNLLCWMANPTVISRANIDITSDHAAHPCGGCTSGKLAQRPFHPLSKHAKHALDIVHTDLIGPMPTTSIQGSCYFVSFLNDFSGHVLAIPLCTKSDFATTLNIFLSWAEMQVGQKVKVI